MIHCETAQWSAIEDKLIMLEIFFCHRLLFVVTNLLGLKRIRKIDNTTGMLHVFEYLQFNVSPSDLITV